MARFVIEKDTYGTYTVIDSVRAKTAVCEFDCYMGAFETLQEGEEYQVETEQRYAEDAQKDTGTMTTVMTHWTKEDIAVLCKMAEELAFQDHSKYCEYCCTKLSEDHSKYCIYCQDIIVDYLFQQSIEEMAFDMQQKLAVERGLY
jgi:hypothetical protein